MIFFGDLFKKGSRGGTNAHLKSIYSVEFLFSMNKRIFTKSSSLSYLELE